MPKLTIDSEKSLYEPIEVEIGGKLFSLKAVTQEMLDELVRLEADILKGNLSASAKRLELFFGPSELFAKQDLRDVKKIIWFIIRSLLTPEPDEKKEPGPEESKSQ